MSNFKKIVNDVKYEERRLSGISYMPDSIFSIVEKYIDDSVKSVIVFVIVLVLLSVTCVLNLVCPGQC